MVLCFVVPVLIGLTFGRPLGGLLWGGVVRVVVVHHFTFFINSLCHFVGKRPFELNTSARDSWWVAYLTFGEGFHNFHHKFQWDYRNGIRWYDFDPGKWVVKLLSFFTSKTKNPPLSSISFCIYFSIDSASCNIVNFGNFIVVGCSDGCSVGCLIKGI